jgi:D-beta-D-heptose 7-phosphate kinase/D-beta-D-heptose 1-phosphate adenosyltransferase
VSLSFASSSNPKILILGDLMVDKYYLGQVSRISPEAPVPIVQVKETRRVLGGAGNVVENLIDLGAQVYVCGVLGLDPEGEWFRQKLVNRGIDVSGVIQGEGYRTIVKTRVVAGRHQMIRLDWEEVKALTPSDENEVLDKVEEQIARCQAVVFSDYRKGFLTPSFVRHIMSIALREKKRVLCDTKLKDPAPYYGATVMTPNVQELAEIHGKDIKDEAQFIAAGQAVRERYNLKCLIVTRSEKGMTLFSQDEAPWSIGTVAQEVFDVTGAGDTVLAALTSAIAEGGDIKEAMLFATLAAGVVISKAGTASVTRAEIAASQEEPRVREFVEYAMRNRTREL